MNELLCKLNSLKVQLEEGMFEGVMDKVLLTIVLYYDNTLEM